MHSTQELKRSIVQAIFLNKVVADILTSIRGSPYLSRPLDILGDSQPASSFCNNFKLLKLQESYPVVKAPLVAEYALHYSLTHSMCIL